MLPANNEQLEKFLHENFKTDKEMNAFMDYAKRKNFSLDYISELECDIVLNDLNGMYDVENSQNEE